MRTWTVLHLLIVIILIPMIAGMGCRLCAGTAMLPLPGIARLRLRHTSMLLWAVLRLLRRQMPVTLGMLVGPRRLMRLSLALLCGSGPR
ncbi:MAG: hypothetical protein ACTHM8_03790 [Sphingomonas sp.]